MKNLNNERLPEPNAEELHYAKKIYYVTRMYHEVSPEKYGIENIDSAKWINKTFDNSKYAFVDSVLSFNACSLT